MLQYLTLENSFRAWLLITVAHGNPCTMYTAWRTQGKKITVTRRRQQYALVLLRLRQSLLWSITIDLWKKIAMSIRCYTGMPACGLTISWSVLHAMIWHPACRNC